GHAATHGALYRRIPDRLVLSAAVRRLREAPAVNGNIPATGSNESSGPALRAVTSRQARGHVARHVHSETARKGPRGIAPSASPDRKECPMPNHLDTPLARQNGRCT